jgi:phosphatidylethanolamine-binding protein (PEBP) family uncharacterized protein
MDYIELTLSTLLYRVRSHESQRFVVQPPFKAHPNPTITVSAPEIGASGSNLPFSHTQESDDLFPTLSWTAPPELIPSIKEYLLICQDVDAPLPSPIIHGIFYNLPATKTSASNPDFEPACEFTKGQKLTRKAFKEQKPKLPENGGLGDFNLLAGGFRFGRNLRGIVYGGPKALKGHGVHRYYFMVVALGEGVKWEGLDRSEKEKTRNLGEKEILGVIEDKVVGWGEWVGCSERKWRG